jgi:hypothetical protein
MKQEQELAEQHVDWLLEILRPLMITEFLHGFKHGVESVEESQLKNKDWSSIWKSKATNKK